MPTRMPTPPNRTLAAASAREHALAHLARPLAPARSWGALAKRCGGRPRRPVVVARVPKTGSTHFLFGLRSACNTSFVDLLWDHQAIAADGCSRTSLATLREPCERLWSSYRHLKQAMTPSYSNTHCRYTPQRCAGHWVHGVTSADELVQEVRSRWREILGYPLSLSRRTGSWARGFSKHEVVLLPQALWLGNFSAVVCTPNIDLALPRLASALNCQHTPNVSSSLAHPGRPPFELSDVACRDARRLYDADMRLWQRHCEPRPASSTWQ